MHHNGTPTRAAWTQQEDAMLRAAVARFGERDWASVSTGVPGRSAKSCSDRWRNFLSPDIAHPRKNPFSPWEVAVVVEAHKEYANNWKTIALLLPGRTNRAVKNLYVGNMKKGERLPRRGENKYLDSAMPLHALLSVPAEERGTPLSCAASDVSEEGDEASEGGCAWEDAEGGAAPGDTPQQQQGQGYPPQEGLGYGSSNPGYGYGPYGAYAGGEGAACGGASYQTHPGQFKAEPVDGMVGSGGWGCRGHPGGAQVAGGDGSLVAGMKRSGDVEGEDAEAYPQVAAARSPKRHRGSDAAPPSPRTPGSRRGSVGGNPYSSSSSGGAARAPPGRSRLGRSLTGSGAPPEAPVTPLAHQVSPGDAFVPSNLPNIRTGIGYGGHWVSSELLELPDTGRRVSAGLGGPFTLGGSVPFSTPLAHLKQESSQGGAGHTSTQGLLLPPGTALQHTSLGQQVAGPGTPLKAAAPLQLGLTAQGSTAAAPPLSPFSVTAVQSGGGEAALQQQHYQHQQQQQQQQADAALEVQYIQANNHMYCQQHLMNQPPAQALQQQQQQALSAGGEDMGAAILQQLQYPDAPTAPGAPSSGPGPATTAAAARGGSLLHFGMSPGCSLNLDFQNAPGASLLDILGDTPVTPPGDACSLDLSQGPLLAAQPKASLDPVSWLNVEVEEEGKEAEGGEGPWLDMVGAAAVAAAAAGGSGVLPPGVASPYRMSSVAAADGWAPRPGRHSGSASGGSSHGSPLHPSAHGGGHQHHHHHHHALEQQQQQQQHMVHQALHYPLQQQQYQVAGHSELGPADMGVSPGDGKFLVPQQRQAQPQQKFTAQQAAYMHLMGHGPAGGAAGYL